MLKIRLAWKRKKGKFKTNILLREQDKTKAKLSWEHYIYFRGEIIDKWRVSGTHRCSIRDPWIKWWVRTSAFSKGVFGYVSRKFVETTSKMWYRVLYRFSSGDLTNLNISVSYGSAELKELKIQIQDLLCKSFINPSTSP